MTTLLTGRPIDKDLRPPMDLWAPIKMNQTEIKYSSEYADQ
jgi:hypothetical protein